MLIKLVEKYRAQGWNKVSSYMPTRTARQCRDRWEFCLRPDINKSPWTIKEDKEILKLESKFGKNMHL